MKIRLCNNQGSVGEGSTPGGHDEGLRGGPELFGVAAVGLGVHPQGIPTAGRRKNGAIGISQDLS